MAVSQVRHRLVAADVERPDGDAVSRCGFYDFLVRGQLLVFLGDGGVSQIEVFGAEQSDTIGAGFVRLSITPETPPGAAAPPPQTRDIQLHPEDLTVDSEEVELVGE